MERNTFIIGKISNMPQIVKNGEIMRIAFSVTDSETGAVIPIFFDTSANMYDRIKSGKTVEITGRAFTRKMTVNGKVKCQRTVLAQSFSIAE